VSEVICYVGVAQRVVRISEGLTAFAVSLLSKFSKFSTYIANPRIITAMIHSIYFNRSREYFSGTAIHGNIIF
jgi:hypothetical protein